MSHYSRKPKRLARPKVNFENQDDLEVVVLAKLGMSNAYIAEQTNLNDGQISYRLTKAKKLQGYHKGHTYRSEWRNGTGDLVRAVLTSVVPSIREEAKAVLPGMIHHPTPEVSNSK
jgi:hypothetical protein